MVANKLSEYPLARSKREAERLHKQHVWQQICLNDQIVFAPVDLQKQGSLLRDLQKQVPPSAELIGMDLTAAFLPESPQGNIRYTIGNVCDTPSEDLVAAFDFTHLRYLLVGCGKISIDTLIANLLSTVRPGGWLQVQELDVTAKGEEQGQAVADFNQILGSIWDMSGLGAKVVHDLKDAFTRAGLQNVCVHRLALPVGRKLENEGHCAASLEPHGLLIPNIVQGAKALGVDLPLSTFDSLKERFEEEMLQHGAVFNSIVVYGQKPIE